LAYFRHSSIENLDPTRTPAGGASCVCVFSFVYLLYWVRPADGFVYWTGSLCGRV
jgi:hypothetical protein